MSSTFKSWLIANFEIFASIAFAIIVVPLCFIFKGGEDLLDKNMLIWLLFTIAAPSILALMPSEEPTARVLENIIAYLAVFVGYAGSLLAIFIVPEYRWIALAFLPLFIGAFVASFILARYAYRHFDEVVSVRMLYSNSNASVFQEQWKYTIDRFFKISFSFICGIVGIALAIGALNGVLGLSSVSN